MNKIASSPPLHAVIIGGGIGGLSAANALRLHGVSVTVYEQAKVLGEVGAGLVVYPNSLRQLERIGLGDRLAQVGAVLGPGSEYYRMDGTLVSKIQITDSAGWNGLYGMHRADLLQVLADALPAGCVQTDHRCVALQQSESGARLQFSNGTSADADIVVAADGLHSTLQRQIVDPQPPEYSGVRAYRGLVSAELLPDWPREAHLVWMGDGKHFMVYPVRGGSLLNYVGFVPTSTETVESWSAPGDRNELASAFAGWDSRIVDLLEQVETCYWWGLYDRRPLSSWADGRLVLLGDAAHAMLPHLGQGANQAIEDGFALAMLLEQCRPADVPERLRLYERFRRQRTDVIQDEARKQGLRFDSKYASLEKRDREIVDAAQFRRWLYDYDVGKDALSVAMM